MSSLIAAPDLITTAATDLANIGSTLRAAHTAAATPTLPLTPAAADEVSASIAHLFSRYAQGYQRLAGRAAVFHEQFVQHLTSGAGSYASAEAANASSLRASSASAGTLNQLVNAWLDEIGLQENALNAVLAALHGFSNLHPLLTPLLELASVPFDLALGVTYLEALIALVLGGYL